ncbi:protein transport protein sec16a [Echinococcus multilocularis]|uniref:Protein transport protein sec16a n=1 Tax=Echinococcus multilocularis TaxID=6211 RepID=A0A087W0I2_ECHMU|nr:protein transport protein sec16a [Echinococcus multilocularis]
MEYGVSFPDGACVPQDKLDQTAASMATTVDGDIPREDSFNLIDLTAQLPSEQACSAQPLNNSAYTSKSFVEDLAGLQPAVVDTPNPPGISKKNHIERVSLLPLHSRSPKRSNRHAGNRFNELIHNRSSTPESIASEMDPYTQWYHVMQNYYKQFYPGYDFGKSAPECRQLMQQQLRHVPKSVVPLIQPTTQPAQQQQQPFALPGLPSWPAVSQPHSQKNPPQFADYAAYYYQYYLGAMAAANGWPIPMGRTTPKVFIEPHARATLSTPGMLIQILPNRPQEGEPGRVELLDISQLASDVVAEVGSRLTQVSISARKMHHSGIVFTNSYQGSSEGPASTLPDNEEMEDDEVEEEYMRLVNAWDRTDHILYPGPLCQDTTLKHDVQAFLRGKVEDIQDRMPVDWDSASLLLAYLELLVKNNGIVHPGDVVNLLLGNEGSRPYDYSSSAVTLSVSPFSVYRVSTLPKLSRHGSFHYPTPGAAGRGIMDESSGCESPCLLTHASSTVGFSQLQQQQQRSASASSTGGASVSRLMRKGLLADLGGAQEREAAALQRFRELLMHGHPLKALDQACQQQLWGHAFALAQRLGPVLLKRVMEKFLTRAVHPHDPLLTLYQLTAGEIPRSVDQLAYAVGADTGDWRPHLAMLLSAPEGHEDLALEALERMGESLLARRLLFAAHLCFLLAASSAASAPPHMPSRIWLIGLAMPKSEERGFPAEDGHFVMTATVERAPTEAVQLTEIYEYALALATRDRHFFLPHLLPFKFAYCLRLIDAGLIEKAFRYLEVLSNSLSTLLEQEVEEPDLQPTDLRGLFLMASQCLRLSEKLCLHPEVGSFEASTTLDNYLGGSASSRSHHSFQWMERLRNVYQRVCSMFGLPNADRPYLDPVPTPSRQAPEEQQPQPQRPEIQNSAPPSYLKPPLALNKQPEPPLRQQQNTYQHQNQQPPQTHQQQSILSPGHNSAVADTHLPPQTITHCITSSQGQPPSSPSLQPEIPSASDTCFQKKEPLQNQYQEPVTPHKATPSSPTTERSVSSHQAFFVPSLHSSNPNAASAASETFGYDYFAEITSSQPIPRSRTVSMASSHDGSTIAGSPSPTSTTASPSSSTLQSQVARRVSNSGSLLRDQRSRNPTSRASPLMTSGGGDDSEAKRGHPAFTTAPPQPPIVKAPTADNHRQPSEQPQLQQPQSEEKSGATSGKSGWFSGLFGRMRGGGQEIYLPDDSNPSIVWNEAAGCWQDVEGGDLEETVPPPPPPPSVPTAASLPPGHTGAVPPLLPPTLRSSGGGASTRTRYVNVLASSGGGTTKAATLTPPLPTPHPL